MANNSHVKIPGTKMRLGAGEYVLAPITLRRFFDLEQDFEKLVGTDDVQPVTGAERFRLIARFIVASLERNYDAVKTSDGSAVQLSEDAVLEHVLDMGNREQALSVALGISGLEPSGETPAAAETRTDSQESSTESLVPMGRA